MRWKLPFVIHSSSVGNKSFAESACDDLTSRSLPAYVGYMNRFQIAPEERMLAARFGAGYEQYRQRVQRWLQVVDANPESSPWNHASA